IMMALTVGAWYLGARRQLYERRGFLRACVWAIPTGYVAVTAGWITTEVGRQPWVVYGHMRTRDAVTPFLTGGDVIASLALYIVVYAIIFGAGCYFLVRLVRRGPQAKAEDRGPRMGERPARPLSAATESETTP